MDTVTILVCGALGTGKTTLRRKAPGYFRPLIGDTAVMGIDDLYNMIDPDWSLQDGDWGKVAMVHSRLLAESFFQKGVKVVLIEGNGLHHAEFVDQYREALSPVSDVYHFTLDVELDTVVERIKKRGDIKAHPPDFLDSWLKHVQEHRADWTHVIDTTDLTTEDILDVIYQRMQNREGVLTEAIGS